MSISSDNEDAYMALTADLIARVVRAGFEDWSTINKICDLSASRDLCALQANLTLAEELRAATTDHRILRAARLWAIMLRRGGEQFIEYNASPASNFLEAVEGVISQRSDSGAGARLLRVLGSATYDFSGTDPMHPYAILWVKVKHPGQPSLGLRMPDSDALLRPTNPNLKTSPDPTLSSSTRAAPIPPDIITPLDPAGESVALVPGASSISVQRTEVLTTRWDPYNSPRAGPPYPDDPRSHKGVVFDSRGPSNPQTKSLGLRLPSFTSTSPALSSSLGSELVVSLAYNASDDSSSVSHEKPRKRSFRRSMVDSIRSSLDKVRIKDLGSPGNVTYDDEPDDLVQTPDSASNSELPSFPTNSVSHAPPPIPLSTASSSNSPTSPTSSDIFSLVHAGLDAKITLNMSIADFCGHIRGSPLAKDSHITSLIWNKEQSGVKHEFLLIEIVATPPTVSPDGDTERRGMTTWLRLDRAARKGYRGFRNLTLRSSSAVFPANDTAMMSTNKTALVGETSKIQANVGFRSPPTLLDLETLLRVICEESAEYDLFKENCYFFCSVIQQVLSELHLGQVEYGKPLHPTLGADARRRITERLRQHSVPWTMPNA